MKLKLIDEDNIESGFDDITDKDYEEYDSFPYEQFAKDLFDMINELISDECLNEEFISHYTAQVHFDRHCLCKHTDRVSKPNNIYYDFTDIMQYTQYELKITDKILDDYNIVNSLEQTDLIKRYIYNLFKGNSSIIFNHSCGFENEKGPVSICFYAFSSDVTKNYKGGNTVDICIKPKDKNKTITLYALDANRVESKLNSLILKYSDSNIQFDFNE